MFNRYPSLLFLILIIKSLLIGWLILKGDIGLGPDEAQYWTWSQALDWGYYSKPPAIAWQIALSTALFGSTEFGVRFGALVIGLLLPFAVYYLSICTVKDQKMAFWAALLMAFSLLGFSASFFAITDGGMVLFWTLALSIMAASLSENLPINGYALGIFIALGALFKWPIYILWLIVLIGLKFYPVWRHRSLWGGCLFSLLALLPSLWWNFQHNFVTFRHVLATLQGQRLENSQLAQKASGNFFEFLGAQAALVSPIIFILMILALVYLFRKYRELPQAIEFLTVLTAAFLGSYLVLSVFQKLQGNWASFIYPSAFVLTAYVWTVKKPNLKWLTVGLGLSIVLTGLLVSLPTLQRLGLSPLSARYNLFKHNVGWRQLAPVLTEAGYNPNQHFLFSDKYQTASLLSFYGPLQKRAYFLNLHGTRLNQFSFWSSLKEQRLGQSGFFILTENAPHLHNQTFTNRRFYEEHLPKYFDKVTYIGTEPLFFSHGHLYKGAMIFYCEHYNGQEPQASSHY